MEASFNEWEKPLRELEAGIVKLKELARKEGDAAKRATQEAKIVDLETGRDRYIDIMYSNLGPWEKVLVARAEKRPYTLDYVAALFTEYVPLGGDRLGHDDEAIVGGPASFAGEPVMVLGHQKGRNIQERQKRNFAMAKPEGYRKAIRLFEMAERFRLPVVTFVDTPAADPGVESESRGISEAIASSMMAMFALTVPTVSIIIGEGGSGGAIGIAASNRVAMLEHSIYSVIPPEGCAAILWRAPEKAHEAAKALRLTAQGALEAGIIDEIVSEPKGGAHRDLPAVFESVRESVRRNLDLQRGLGGEELREARYAKYRDTGVYGSV